MKDAQSQPSTEHTPTPWRHYHSQIRGPDNSILCVVPNNPENGKNWIADSAFIVEAVNSHASLRAKVDELTAALREAHRLLADDCDWSAQVLIEKTLLSERASLVNSQERG